MINDLKTTSSGRKKILFSLILAVLLALILELGARIVFAFHVGPRVLLYGTSAYRNIVVLPGESGIRLAGDHDAHRKGRHAAVGNTDQEVRTGKGGYAKYFPGESKVDFDEHGVKFAASINDRGFRGGNFELQKAPGVIRVVALGASSTFGYYDRDNETYPYYLETILDRESDTADFEVINFGIPHLTSSQIVELFQAEVLPLNADVVTFYEGINDASQMPDAVWSSKREEKTAESWYGSMRRRLSSFTPIRDAYAVARERLIVAALVDSLLTSDVLTYDEHDLRQHLEGKSSLFLENISSLRAACLERGIIFVVLNQQARSMMERDVKGVTYEEEAKLVSQKLKETGSITHQEKTFLAHQVLMRDLEAWAEAEGVPFVDIIDELNQDREVVLSWVHLNPRGNMMIAEALAKEILRQLQQTGRVEDRGDEH